MRKLVLAVVVFLATVGPATAQRCVFGLDDQGRVVCFDQVPGPGVTPVPQATAVIATVAPSVVTATPVPAFPSPLPTIAPQPTSIPEPPAPEPQLPDLPGLVTEVQLMEGFSGVNQGIMRFIDVLNQANQRGQSTSQEVFNSAMAINWLWPGLWRAAPFGRSIIGAIRGELCINGAEQIPDCPR